MAYSKLLSTFQSNFPYLIPRITYTLSERKSSCQCFWCEAVSASLFYVQKQNFFFISSFSSPLSMFLIDISSLLPVVAEGLLCCAKL